MARDPAEIARALGLVYLGGPTVAVVALLLPHSSRTDETAIWILIGIAYAVVPLLFGLYRRLPVRVVELLIAFAALLVTLVVWFDQEIGSEFAFFYLWPTPFAFVYFTLPRALAQLAFSATAYGVTLVLLVDRYPSDPAADWAWTYWLLEVSALITVGLLVRALAKAIQDEIEQRETERRRRALDINDSILQGLVVAQVAHEQGREDQVTDALRRTLEEARGMISDLLDPEIHPGDLRRERAAGTEGEPGP